MAICPSPLPFSVCGRQGEGGRLLNAVCRANKRDGSPCTAPATGANGYCWAHDPANAEQRRRIASRGGRGKGSGEIADLKAQLADLAKGVLDGQITTPVVAVVNQILNTRARLLEVERRLKESEELEARLETLENVMKVRRTR